MSKTGEGEGEKSSRERGQLLQGPQGERPLPLGILTRMCSSHLASVKCSVQDGSDMRFVFSDLSFPNMQSHLYRPFTKKCHDS